MSDSDHDVQGHAAGGVPDPSAHDGGERATRTDEASLDATLRMSDEEWLEHALGDIHSSAWTTPTVEL